MPLGLFTGTRTYDLSTNDTGTSVTMTESYAGPMASIIGKRLPNLQPSFESFVAGWRYASEAPTAVERRNTCQTTSKASAPRTIRGF